MKSGYLLIAGVLFIMTACKTSPQGNTEPQDIPETQMPVQENQIIEPPDRGTYDSSPPSSGPHWDQPSDWGVKSEEPPPAVWVNNLAQGGIVLLLECPDYLGGCPDLMAEIETWMNNDLPATQQGTVKVLAFPSSMANTQIVALAWGWKMELADFNPSALTEFYIRHIDQVNETDGG